MTGMDYYLRIANHLAGKLDISSALRSVKSEIDQIIEVDHLDVCLIDDDQICNTSYEVGMQTDWSETRSLVSISPVRDILIGKSDMLLTGNALQDERYVFPGSASEPIIKHKLHSRVNVAMKVLGETIGALNCSSQKLNFYDERSVEQVRIVADILAPYFYALRASEKAKREAIMRTEIQAREEGLRMGALSLTDALEAERQRIGMDLHDQTLADLTRIARDLRQGNSLQQNERLQRRIQNCIQGLRDIIDASSPSILELFGFQHAIHTHLERAISGGENIIFDVTDSTNGAMDKLPDATRTAVFRICQEAINNAVQHSGASCIHVTVSKDSKSRLTFVVNDDGAFQENAERPSGGLTHMATRAQLIKAEFKLDKKTGTRITVRLPRQTSRDTGEKT
jgi:signal transduction histidine kinase